MALRHRELKLRAFWAAMVLAAAGSALLVGSALAQDKPLRIDVKLVNVFVNVTDANGALLAV